MPQSKKIEPGTQLSTPHGFAKVLRIEIPEPGQSDGGIEIPYIWAVYKDICVFDLDNKHWAYGADCELTQETISEHPVK